MSHITKVIGLKKFDDYGIVTVQLDDAGRKVVGRGASTDVIEASAKAYIDGLNKLASLDSGVRRSSTVG